MKRVPERTSVPNESRVHLIIEYGTESKEIWEWYNDLQKNHRISDILARIQKIGCKS